MCTGSCARRPAWSSSSTSRGEPPRLSPMAVGRSGSTITRYSYRSRRTEPTHRTAVAASPSSPSRGRVQRRFPCLRHPALLIRGQRSTYTWVQATAPFSLTSCSRRNDTGWHRVTPDDTGRHVAPRSVPGRTSLRIRCPKGRGSSTLPSRTHSDLRIFVSGVSDLAKGTPFLLTLAHRNKPDSRDLQGRLLRNPGAPSRIIRGSPVPQLAGSRSVHHRLIRSRTSPLIVAQGAEAGGHVWGSIGTLVLLPTVVDAVSPTPVIAAGGIGDGRGLAAVLVLGAQAAWMGTRFVVADKTPSDPAYRDRIVLANENDAVLSSGVFDRAFEDAPVRTLNNSTLRRWRESGSPEAGRRPGENDVVAHREDGSPILRYATNPPNPRVAGRSRSDVQLRRSVRRPGPPSPACGGDRARGGC